MEKSRGRSDHRMAVLAFLYFPDMLSQDRRVESRTRVMLLQPVEFGSGQREIQLNLLRNYAQ